MPKVLLLPENLKTLKRSLVAEFPDMKSSHLSEAMAGAFGFNTHIGMKTAIESSDRRWPENRDFYLEGFEKRAFEVTGKPPEKVDVMSLVRKADVPLKLWSEYQVEERAANNDWFHHCNRRNIPMVYIEWDGDLASVWWDCITTEPPADAPFRNERGDNVTMMLGEMFSAMSKSYEGCKADWSVSSFAGHIDNLRPNEVYQFADNIAALLYWVLRDEVLRIADA